MSDVMLYQSPDGGEIDIASGVVSLDDTPFTAIYISLFGGNAEDSGNPNSVAAQWWGNFDEADESALIRSRTQSVLTGLPAIPANLQRVKSAVELDLAWLTRDVASEVTVQASMPARGLVKIEVFGKDKDGTSFMFDFTRPWGAR